MMDVYRAVVLSATLVAYPALHYAERVDNGFYYRVLPLPRYLAWSLLIVVVTSAWYLEFRRTSVFRLLAAGVPSFVFVALTLALSSAMVVGVHRYSISQKVFVYHLSPWLFLAVLVLNACLLIVAFIPHVRPPRHAKA